ncbi:uncharacterized protein K460DRAFT_402241 [Cucurbitaria berberidis CBS 394.84]|uniref:Rhodopsin domain-containing protein n=1 Tax=Cucurbitaria berberidis CBS 394.84 TaxID=1168544 RepID=A0A9P4GK60_9PLEO|nr:uncharacterized protein K460DRAFT_402241 [Cucurbitaria berberidis CBS 394.84]KAF1846871.1 hypothetical protein K460DRAFT_402241 [Cucurbitaria berberidis CBS 394.84]
MALPDIPLSPPPTVIDDTHKHYDVATAVLVLMIVATGFTVARFYLRWKSHTFGWDDWIMIPAVLLYIGHSIMIAYCNLHGGTGKPLWEITLGEYSIWFQGVVGTAFLYPAMTACIRISILLFYRRIFGQAEAVVRLSIWAMIVLNCAFIVTFEIMPAFICTPMSAGWRNPLTRKLHCRQDEFYYLYNIGLYSSGLGMDIILLLMPVYPVMRLQMSLKRKLGALIMFMLGASACIAASYKLAIYVTQWGRTGTIDPKWWHTQMSRAIPPQWDKYGYTFWIPTHVEPTVAIIGSSLPALRNCLQIPFQKLSSAISESKASGYSSRARRDDTDGKSSQSKYTKMRGGSAAPSQKHVELTPVRSVKPA